MKRVIETAVRSADSQFCLKSGIEGWTDGTTATFLVVVPHLKGFFLSNTGDSRAVLMRRPDEAIALHRIHSPDMPTEKERLLKSGATVKYHAGAWRVNSMLALSRAVGDAQLKSVGVVADPDVSFHEVDASKDEYIVLATDGLWDVLSEQEAYLEVKYHAESERHCMQATAEKLARKAYELGSTDNISVVLLNIARMFAL